MINLIRNELCKIFHKKILYVMGIITLVITGFNLLIYRVEYDDIEKDYISGLEESLNNYDLNNLEELKWYVDDLSYVETQKKANEYEDGSWQRKMVLEELTESISCLNNAKYITKNDILYNECKKEYDKIIEYIEIGDWKVLLNRDKDEYVKELNELKDKLNNDQLSDVDKSEINKSIQVLNYQIEGIDIRLNKNIAPDYSNASSYVDEYVSYAIMYLEYDKNDDNYVNREDLLEKRNVESTYYINKYILDNDLYSNDSDYDSKEFFMMDNEGVLIIVLMVVILIASSIVAEEYNKGTIKQLLLRPYSRIKILLSKYITCLIVFGLFMLFYSIVTYIGYGFIGGFKDYLEPIVIYNFNTSSVMELNVISYSFYNFVALLPEYLILLSLAFFVSTVFGNTSLAIIVSVLSYFGAGIVNIAIEARKIKYLSWFPSMCWDFTDYLFGNIPRFEYSNFILSIVVSIITVILLVGISFIVFKKKDIKNI